MNSQPLPAGADAQPAQPAVRMTGYHRRFGDRLIVSHVDLEIRPGEMVALLGASGSGKSTLLRALAGLDPEAGGHVRVPAERTIVFQDHRLLPWRRVWRNVLVRLRGHRRGQALAALAEVGLEHLAEAWPATLSGGEAQRVALARAFIRQPRLLLLDEPFGALDALTRLRMHDLLRALWERHRPATLMVTHDVDEAIALADRVLVLSRGVLTIDEPVSRAPPSGPADIARSRLRARLLDALGVQAAEPPPSAPRQPAPLGPGEAPPTDPLQPQLQPS